MSFRIYDTICPMSTTTDTAEPPALFAPEATGKRGIAFEGGGIRAATHGCAVLILLLYRLKKSVSDLFENTVYFGSNSAGSWVNALLMTYSNTEVASSSNPFPLDTLMTATDAEWKNFYNKYWLDKVRMAPHMELGAIGFEAFSAANILDNSWENSLSKFFMEPFYDALKTIRLDQADFPKNDKIVTFTASVLHDSYIRYTNDIPGILTPAEFVRATWVNQYSTVSGKSIQGGPCNFVHNFRNEAPVTPISRFNMSTNVGQITYNQYSSSAPETSEQSATNSNVPNPNGEAGKFNIFDLASISSAALGIYDTPFHLEDVEPGEGNNPTHETYKEYNILNN